MEAGSMAHIVVAKRPFSPTVHLGQRDLGDSRAGQHPKASTSQDAVEEGQIEVSAERPVSKKSSEDPDHEIKAFKHAYIKVPVTLKDKLPLDYQFRFKPRRKVISLEKKKKPKAKRESSIISKPSSVRHSGGRPIQIAHTSDKHNVVPASSASQERERGKQIQKKARVSLAEHAVQTDSTLTQKRETPKEQEPKESTPPVQVPTPFREKQVHKKKEKNTSSSFLSKGGITVYKPRSHRPQPFFKKALSSSQDDSKGNKAKAKDSGGATSASANSKSPLAPKRFPIAPRLALQEIAKEKELEAKRLSDEQKRKSAVAGLLQRAKQNIQKEYIKRSQDLESKMQESSLKFTHVSAILQNSQQATRSSASDDTKVSTSGSSKSTKARVPLTPANLNKPTKAPLAKPGRSRKEERNKDRDENVKQDLEKLLEDGPNSEGEGVKKSKGERDYPKLWQTNMKKPAPKPAAAAAAARTETQVSTTASAKADESGKPALGDLYDILDQEPSAAEKEDEKREEILRFMKKKRQEMSKALKESKDKELEKRYMLRNVHHKYGESSKLKARDLALHHKDLIVKAEKRLKARPAWIVEFAVETEEEESEQNSAVETEESKEAVEGGEKGGKSQVEPTKRAVKLVKIPKRGQKPKSTSSDKLKIKSTVKALSTPPKSTKKAQPEEKPVPAKQSDTDADLDADPSADVGAVVAKKKSSKKKAATLKSGKVKSGKTSKSGKKLSKMQKDIDELKEASVNALSESNLLSKLNQVAQRLHNKLLALEQGGPLSEENQKLADGLEDLELATNFDAEEAMRATEALHQQLFVTEVDGSGSEVQTPIQSPSRSPARGGLSGTKDHTNSAVAEALRATEELHQQLQLQHQSDSESDAKSPLRSPGMSSVRQEVEGITTTTTSAAEEARKATEALHEQLLVQQQDDSETDAASRSNFSEIHEAVSPVRSIVGSLIEEGIMSDYTLSPKERVEADLVTNVVSLIVPSSPEVEHRSPMIAKSPKSARKIQFEESPFASFPQTSNADQEFDIRGNEMRYDNQDVLPKVGDKYSIVDIYAKKNARPSPKQLDPIGADDHGDHDDHPHQEQQRVEGSKVQDVEIEKAAVEELRSPSKIESTAGATPPAASPLASPTSLSPTKASNTVSSESQTQTDLAGVSSEKPPASPKTPSSTEKKKTKKLKKSPSSEKKAKKLKKSPSPVKKKKEKKPDPPSLEEEKEEEEVVAVAMEEDEKEDHETKEQASPGKRINIPTSATALAGQLQAELARFTTLSDMSDHLSKLEQKIEVVQLMKESEVEAAAAKRSSNEGSQVDYTEQLKELMNNIYEQQKDLTDEMKQAIQNQSSVFVEKLRDTAAVQSNFYQETLKHTAKEMAQIMSNESSKSLESICASFEDRLKDYTQLQQAMKDSLDSAAKSVEVISRQQSPVHYPSQQPSPRMFLEGDPSSVIDTEYTQDFDSDFDQDGQQHQPKPALSPSQSPRSPKKKQKQQKQGKAGVSSPKSSTKVASSPQQKAPRDPGTGTDSEAVSEIEEIITTTTPSRGPREFTSVVVGSENSEIAEDIQESGSESVSFSLPTKTTATTGDYYPPASPAGLDQNLGPSLSKNSISTDIEVEISEAVMSVAEEISEAIVVDDVVEMEDEQEEEEEVVEMEEEPQSFQSSSGMVLSLEMPELQQQEEEQEEKQGVGSDSLPKEQTYRMAEEAKEDEGEVPEEIIPEDLPEEEEGEMLEEDIQGFVFQDEDDGDGNGNGDGDGDGQGKLPPLVQEQQKSVEDQEEEEEEEEDQEEGQEMEMESQHFVNINDIGYSMRYVDTVLDRVNAADILKSLEEESDPIHTDHFFKIEEATASSDPEYIYHKLLFDTINEVLLNKINQPDFKRDEGKLEETIRDAKAKVERMVKFGLVNLDPNQELVNIHNLETEEETKIFSELDSFFKDTREELVDGIFHHILEDTVKVLNESSALD